MLTISVFSSILYGSVKLNANDIINYFINGSSGNNVKDTIISKLRMPRTIGAIIGGIGISIAGILMQGYFRNPLADPYFMGVASGASLGVVLYIFTSLLFTLGIPHSVYGFIISAYIGSFITTLVVVNIAKSVKQTSTLLICGLMVGMIASGITTAVIYVGDYVGESNNVLKSYLLWSMGSVNNLTWEQINIMAIIVLLVSILSYIMLSKKLDANLLGEHYAISLGIDIKNFKKYLLILSCILTATIVAFTGPIAFIGIVCPIISRMLCNTSKHIYVIPITALLGATLLVVADIATRPGVLFHNTSTNLPLLCPLSIIGAPIAIAIYLKIRKMGI